MNVPWEDVFSRLKPGFDQVIESLAGVNVRAHAKTGRTSAESFPFGAFLSFRLTDEPGREDVVISIDCKKLGADLALSSDISRGDGFVLSEGPRRTVPTTQEGVEALLHWIEEVVEYMRSNVTLVAQELSSKS